MALPFALREHGFHIDLDETHLDPMLQDPKEDQ
jgi:hypothetical protein